MINGEGQAIRVWDLRLIREQLAKMGLDWDMPSYPPKSIPDNAPPLKVNVDLGDLDPKKPKSATGK